MPQISLRSKGKFQHGIQTIDSVCEVSFKPREKKEGEGEKGVRSAL